MDGTTRATISRRSVLKGMAVTAAGVGAGLAGRPGSAAGSVAGAEAAGGITATSPGHRATISVMSAAGSLAWSATYDGSPVVVRSQLGLVLDSGYVVGPAAQVRRVATRRVDSNWRPQYGRNAALPDRYEEIRVELVDADASVEFAVVARAYDEGVALCYELTGGDPLTLAGEATAFSLPDRTRVYSARDEDPFVLVAPHEIPSSGSAGRTDTGPLTDQPVTAVLPDGTMLCVCESARLDYPRLMLAGDPDHHGMLRAHLMQYAGRGSTQPVQPTFEVTPPFTTPWRVAVLAANSAELIDHADLVVTLAAPARVPNTDWIRPGKAIREVTLTTAGALHCVDFAAQRGLAYIEFDAGWYGPETNPTSDPTKPIAALDLPQVIAYGKTKDVGVILYVNQLALTDPGGLFALYEQWGVSGLKLGFIYEGTQSQTAWLSSVAETAASYRLLLNTHDDLRPFGQERTYPNWITLEGVRGNEHFPTATHNVTVPFCRNIGGPMDMTICLAQPRDQTTNVHQMAMAAVYYQPLAWFYWYDQPAKYATGSWPELPWFDAIPTTWDESRALAGEIAQYVVMARRSGSTWFVGAMTNEQSRILDVPLDFLGAGSWQATIYADSGTPDNARDTQVVVRTQAVTSATVLTMRLSPAGGQAVVITPA
ncbi:MAG TPA: glycoside hydrolase family 97 catalytic domain-containing protein [Jatrophihabitans sp.]|jgi:alpha-glucosidase|nr:glycoside hydrolase family 97 catalytic domain-containing protein [Jatrophihabitans sp.]